MIKRVTYKQRRVILMMIILIQTIIKTVIVHIYTITGCIMICNDLKAVILLDVM